MRVSPPEDCSRLPSGRELCDTTTTSDSKGRIAVITVTCLVTGSHLQREFEAKFVVPDAVDSDSDPSLSSGEAPDVACPFCKKRFSDSELRKHIASCVSVFPPPYA